MKTVAFVPIKTNNERLPGKNTKCFSNGIPLITYILQTLCKVDGADEIYVYCSDESIRQYLPSNVRFLKRSRELDLSVTSFNKVLTSFAEEVEADLYILAHATAPFIKPESFEKAINAVKSGRYDSALAVQKQQEFLWKGGSPYNYDPVHIPRTQDIEPLYVETCGMYVYTSELIRKYGRRVGNTPCLIEVSKIEGMDINDLEDFMMADAVASIWPEYRQECLTE